MVAAISSLDLAVLRSLYAFREMPFVLLLISVTELGSTLAIGGFTLCTAIVLLYRRHFGELAGLLLSVGGSAAVVFGLKAIVQRGRPDFFFQAYYETDYSFPSGHAAMSVALYGFLAYLIYRSARSRSIRSAAVAGAVILCALIGFSRLYLGVHFLSDVLASWVISGIFLWIATIITERTERLLLER